MSNKIEYIGGEPYLVIDLYEESAVLGAGYLNPCSRCALNKTSMCSYKLCTGSARKDGTPVRFERIVRVNKTTPVPASQYVAPKKTEAVSKKIKTISRYTDPLDALAKEIGPEAYGPNGGVRYEHLYALVAIKLNKSMIKRPSHKTICSSIEDLLGVDPQKTTLADTFRKAKK